MNKEKENTATFIVRLDKTGEDSNVHIYIGVFFILFGLTSLHGDISEVMGLFTVAGILYILSPQISQLLNYYKFTANGILKIRFFNLIKSNFLAYKDIENAYFVANEYVFKNEDLEFRFPKELLNQKEIDYLENKIKVLQKALEENQIK